MKKRFKELLLDIYNKSAEEQSNILIQKLEAWMGDWEQVDDILVIGVELN